MSVRESQTFGKTLSMFEGYGGPVNIGPTDRSGIDPTLEACCEREIVSNRKQSAIESALRRHDRIALAERRRRNVMKDLNFGSSVHGGDGDHHGCRCCYDTNDGGEYRALIDLRSELAVKASSLARDGGDNDNDGDNDDGEGKGDQGREEKYGSDDNDDDSDDDSEFDYLLDEDLPGSGGNGGDGGDDDYGMSNELKLLQQERMEELQLSAMIRESAMQHGFGVHRQFHPQRVLYAAGLGLSGSVSGNSNSRSRSSSTAAAAIPPAAVIHLFEDTLLSASLDICLEEMALNIYRGTKFVRSYGRSTISFNRDLVSKVLPRLNIDTSLPALIAVKNGDVVAMCENLSYFVNGTHSRDDDKVEPRAVEEWLDRTGVLLHDVPIAFEDYCRIRPEEDALLENMMREKAKIADVASIQEEQIYQCGVPGCRKAFHHEHVGVKNEMQDGLVLCQEISTGTEV